MRPPSRRQRDAGVRGNARLLLSAFAIVIGVLAVHTWTYREFMVDDAFISLRYSDRLLNGQGLTWNDGERVEGYSNLLWVLGCSFLGFLGIDLVAAPRILGFLGTAATIAAILWTHRAVTWRGLLPGLAGAFAVALSGPVAIWTIGGLEQPLLAGLLAWVLAILLPLREESRAGLGRALVVGLLLGLIAVTRPDGLVFTLGIVLAYLATRGLSPPPWRTLSIMAGLPALFFAGQLAFRLAYYHDWVPNSAYAKVAFTPERIWAGVTYVSGGVYLLGLLVPALASGFVAAPSRPRRRAIFLLTVLAVWLVYVTFIGGDFFPGHRQLVPAIVVLAFLFAISVESWMARYGSARVLVSGASCLAVLTVAQFLDPRNETARRERWVWDGEAVGTLFSKAFGDRHPLLAVDPAGCVPFFSGLASIDMLGINDHYLAHHRPLDFGRGVVGHELGSGAYVLSRKPDLVLFNLPTGGLRPFFRSGREMVFSRGSNFLATFRPVTFEIERPRHMYSIVWVRTEGGALGIQRTNDRVLVPGFLFSSNRASVARLGSDGRIGVVVTPESPAVFFNLPVSQGHWRLQCESRGDSLDIKAWDATVRYVLAEGTSPLLEVRDPDQRVTLSIETKGTRGAHVHAVVLERAIR